MPGSTSLRGRGATASGSRQPSAPPMSLAAAAPEDCCWPVMRWSSSGAGYDAAFDMPTGGLRARLPGPAAAPGTHLRTHHDTLIGPRTVITDQDPHPMVAAG